MAVFDVVQGQEETTELRPGWYVRRTDGDGNTEIVSQLYISAKDAKADAAKRNAEEPDPHA